MTEEMPLTQTMSISSSEDELDETLMLATKPEDFEKVFIPSLLDFERYRCKEILQRIKDARHKCNIKYGISRVCPFEKSWQSQTYLDDYWHLAPQIDVLKTPKKRRTQPPTQQQKKSKRALLEKKLTILDIISFIWIMPQKMTDCMKQLTTWQETLLEIQNEVPEDEKILIMKDVGSAFLSNWIRKPQRCSGKISYSITTTEDDVPYYCKWGEQSKPYLVVDVKIYPGKKLWSAEPQDYWRHAIQNIRFPIYSETDKALIQLKQVVATAQQHAKSQDYGITQKSTQSNRF